MTEINVFIKILLLFITIYNTISRCSSALSNKRLCYDPQCLEPVSYATVLSTYHSRDKDVMSLKISQQVMVYSKGAGNRTDIWGIKVNGKRGYFPFRFLREDKILHSNLTYLVSTSELNEEKDTDMIDHQPVISSVQSVPSYDIVDGTTIPLNDILSEASQTSHVQPSVLPHEQIEPSLMKLELNTVAKDAGTASELKTNLQSSEESTKHLESSEIDMQSITPTEDVNTDVPISSENVPEISMIDADSLKLNHKVEEVHSGSIADILTTANGIDLSVTEEPQAPIDEVIILPETLPDQVKEKNSEEQVEKRVDPYMAGLFKSSIENGIDVKQQEIPSLTESSVLDSITPEHEVISESPQLSIAPSIPVKFEIPQDTILPQENIVDKEIENVTEVPEDNSSFSDIEKTIQRLEDSLTEEDLNDIIDEMLSTDSPSIPSDINIDGAVEQEKQVLNDEQSRIQFKSPDDENISIEKSFFHTLSSDETKVTQNIYEAPSEEISVLRSTEVPSEESKIAEGVLQDPTLNFNEFPGNRNLLNVEEGLESLKEVESKKNVTIEEANTGSSEKLSEHKDFVEENVENEETLLMEKVDNVVLEKSEPKDSLIHEKEVSEEQSSTVEEINTKNLPENTVILENISEQVEDSLPQKQETEKLGVCQLDSECPPETIESIPDVVQEEEDLENKENAMMNSLNSKRNYWESLIYVCLTAFATLAFSLGYYYIENSRRDAELVAKVNELEKKLFVSVKECAVLEENLKTTKSKLDCIEDESFGSNEMVVSLKADLQALQNANSELEEQNAMLEKELENATEAGLELERMLREVLSTNNEVNPLAQSLEDLQARLNAQQEANESLTNALNFKTQENENLSKELVCINKRNEELFTEISKLTENLKVQENLKSTIEQTLSDKIQKLEIKLKEFSTERSILRKELKNREMEIQDLNEVINQINSNALDLDKLYDVSRIKAEASLLLEERDELKIRLSEVEGAHQLLEEHMQNIKEEVSALSDQCKLAEKEKKDAEAKLEVLSKFFKEKEMERQKEEALWLQKQGEVMSTVERIQTMQNEIQNYKQQVEMLKREIVDQEREYKTQISSLETKAHEHWVLARQNERRWEESKAEAAQLRNRLTLIEKNMNEGDADVKLHRMNTNGETASPALFIGGESSSSPIMFANSSGVPPPPSYIYGSPFPPFIPPPLPSGTGVPPASYDIGQRPPPLGGRLSSPPTVPLHPPSRYDGAGSPPLPHMLPPYDRHRSPPPRPLVVDLRDLPLPRPPHNFTSPPPPPLRDDWDEERLPSPRNNPGSGFHQPHSREPPRVRNHKGSLHSSGESLDKTHHSGKV